MLTPARRAPGVSRFGLTFAISVICAPATQAAAPTLDWMAQYDGLLSFASDQVYDMVVDADGNTYVTGRSDEANGRQIAATVKYAPDGSLVWEDRYVGPSVGGPELGAALALGPNGDLYVAGNRGVDGVNFPGPDMFVARYDANGTRLWVTAYDGTGHDDDYVSDLVVGADGTAYVTGQSLGTTFSYDVMTIAVRADGTMKWTSRFDGPAHFNDDGNAIVLAPNGNVLVAGTVSVNASFNTDMVVLSYDTNGALLWSKQIGGAANRADTGFSIACDAVGSVYAGGYYVAAGLDVNYGIVKLDSAGTQAWLLQYASPGGGSDTLAELALGPDGNLIATGYTAGGALGVAVVTRKYSPAGTVLWTHIGSGLEISNLSRRRIAFDPESNPYILALDVIVGGVIDYSYHPMKLHGATGVLDWEFDFGTDQAIQDFPVAIALAPDYSIRLAGLSKTPDPNTDYDYTVLRYNQTAPVGIDAIAPLAERELHATPNPFRSTTRLELRLQAEEHVRVSLFDAEGRRQREIFSGPVGAGVHVWELEASGLPSGIFYAVVEHGARTTTRRLTILR